ncbi:prepilin-type N-terminal cleavage/methylation domain-containing protein [Coraliomargarita sp. SDUM461004]|uniref:Prepilin-type N-terminal cleavage/methylation domain-containing protein n=1 Tax=Thalassobacterium sedimentorum TaxID=3041258 RepID=A0ABU1ANW0_9BACT|nr:prepilin-type N-terminal cleavage/methylation domain-containing protein [Coraliomargarita sp. SDUM461004]MDQ8195550.1 prepilin-type N-terminal cleavage/methylation domain-containing protein [Coraliomargarita sp. SDUM461004]
MRCTRGFTLVELLVSLSLSIILSAAVLTFYVFFAKATLLASNYSEFDREAGTFLQYFSRDIREAEDIVWLSENEFRLLKKGIYITYTYNSQLRKVTRNSPDQGSDEVASNINDLQFAAYTISGSRIQIAQSLTQANENTKMMQVIGTSSTRIATGIQSSAPIVSARYVLRNKATPIP